MDFTDGIKAFGTIIGFLVGIPTLVLIFKVGSGWGAISKAVTDIASAVGRLSQDLTAMKEEIAKWGERAAVIESKVETVRSDVASLRESRHQHGEKIGASQGRLGVHDVRLDGHDTDIAELRGPSRRLTTRKGGRRKADPK